MTNFLRRMQTDASFCVMGKSSEIDSEPAFRVCTLDGMAGNTCSTREVYFRGALGCRWRSGSDGGDGIQRVCTVYVASRSAYPDGRRHCAPNADPAVRQGNRISRGAEITRHRLYPRYRNGLYGSGRAGPARTGFRERRRPLTLSLL